jgi:Trk K+ transport system NAD-binding subunit
VYVIVAGGGKVGYYLAQHLLSEGHEVLLIERNPDRTAEINDVLGAVAHRAIAEIELPVNTAITAIARGANLIVPNPGTELLPGDDIIAVAHQNQEDELRRLLV